MLDDITQHDSRRRRCPMLGHDLAFSYCRAPGRELPCGRIFDCWWEEFDVQSFIGDHFSTDEIDRILAPRQDKAATLLDLINQARSRQAKDD